jgi:predicted ribosomally synthesized peptide with nif11-like leader
MSVQKAKDFLVHVATEAAAAKAAAAHEGALMKLAGELGFKFSTADLQAAMGEMDSLDTLSEAELDRVAGGRARRYADS